MLSPRHPSRIRTSKREISLDGPTFTDTRLSLFFLCHSLAVTYAPRQCPAATGTGVAFYADVVHIDMATTESSAVGSMMTPSIPALASVGPARAQKPVILLVEDESVVRQVTREVLEHAGYQVLESDGPPEALRLAAAHQGRIALLLSDVVMPGMNGIDLAHRIQKTQPWLATVFMSGYANQVVMQQAEPLSSYIQKPFTIEALLAGVAEALAKSRALNSDAGRNAPFRRSSQCCD
jgi:CheY-like chemotaxis protein